MHLRVQMFQTDVFGQLCSPQSICDNQECSHVLFFCKSNCGIGSVHILESRMCQTGFPNAQECVLARRLSIQMRFLCAQMSSRSTPVDQNAFLMCSNALSLDACLSKCVQLWECVPGFENCLIQIWTERCPTEAIWKQICYSFEEVLLGSKMDRIRCGQEGVKMKPYGSKSAIGSGLSLIHI